MAAYHHVWKKKNFYSEINERNSKVYIYLTYFDSKIEKIQKKEREKKSVYERW